MRVCVLGPVAVCGPTGDIAIPGGRVRRLLTRLAVDAPRPVSVHELVDAVWSDTEPPDPVANALQSLVSRLRRALGDPAAVVQEPGGYRLSGADVDAAEFERLAAAGRSRLAAGDPADAADLLDRALVLWVGEPLVDAADADYAAAWAARLSARRLDALADGIDARLAVTGPNPEMIAELEELTRGYPLRERFGVQLVLALARLGRSAEALGAFERMRAVLADELGADPSEPLRAAHLAVLRGEVGPDGTVASGPALLRATVTSFVGRARELDRIADLLATGRLATIVGPGGAGKTRLAIEAAARLAAVEPGVSEWLVELAPISDESEVIAAFAAAVAPGEARLGDSGREAAAPRDPFARTLTVLASSHGLLVVDNCEHLIDAAARLLSGLLAACPWLRVLATSREPLGVDGESLCVVAPLSLPEPGAGAFEALESPAVVLLRDRANAVREGFAVDASNVADVVEIVRRLDGLPLAIELAAARLRVLPVREVAARLGDRFRLLAGGSRSAMPRHRTLRAVVEWSWDLLADDERRLAELLAVFRSGVESEAARALQREVSPPSASGAAQERDAGELLESLADKSLLSVEADARGVRYRMLETIREYGLERLVERGDAEPARRAHARFFSALVHELTPRLRGTDQLDAFTVLGREHDNIVAALRFLGESGDGAGAVQMACDMSWYWILRNEHADAFGWLRFAVSVSDESVGPLRVLAEAGMALNELVTLEGTQSWATPERRRALREMSDRLATVSGLPPAYEPDQAILRVALALISDDDEAVESVTRELAAAPDRWTRAMMLTLRAAVAENKGDTDAMRGFVEKAIPEFRDLGDRWGIATALTSQAYVQLMDEDLDGAGESYRESAQLMAELGAGSDSGFIRLRLAGLLLRQNRPQEARAIVEEVRRTTDAGFGIVELVAVATLAFVALVSEDCDEVEARVDELLRLVDSVPRNPGSDHGRAMALGAVGVVRALDGHCEEARRALVGAYPAAVETRDRPLIASIAVASGALAVSLGDAVTAARLLGAGAVLRGGPDSHDPVVVRVAERARNALGAAFDVAYAEGLALGADKAIEAADPARVAPG